MVRCLQATPTAEEEQKVQAEKNSLPGQDQVFVGENYGTVGKRGLPALFLPKILTIEGTVTRCRRMATSIVRFVMKRHVIWSSQ